MNQMENVYEKWIRMVRFEEKKIGSKKMLEKKTVLSFPNGFLDFLKMS